MSKGRSRWLLRLAILPVAGLALFLWLSARERERGLTVENRSQQRIVLLEITAGGRTSTFRDVPDGGRVTAPPGMGEGGVTVQGRFPDGTRIKGQFADLAGASELVVLPGGQIAPRKAGR